MRSLKKDKKKIYIARKLPSDPILDSDGNPTGEYAKVYDIPIELALNVKPISNETDQKMFGEDTNKMIKITYTFYDSQGFEIEIFSAVWIDTEPNGILTDGDSNNPMNNNYLVVKTINFGNQNVAYIKRIVGTENED